MHAPSPASPRHRVLIADDDPATRQFLGSALASLGYEVSLAADGEAAIALARRERHEALLLDCRMPLAGAVDVLRVLRDDPTAASGSAVALATSAEVPAALRDALLAEGFVAVIEKPCSVGSLGHALSATLGLPANMTLLDDRQALAASGDEATMGALRLLFRAELVDLDESLSALATQPEVLVDRLHRLRSACGFCGATRLGAQARALQNHVLETRVVVPVALARFRETLRATLAAIGA